ncbi:MAG TPA: hypothetical protein EYP81_01425, partial [Thermodesulfobacteriaceae bacterium]|nr:hypothetical protein [Thermodesulfobacteriaceae bacterium]
RYLGPEQFGLFSYAASFVGLFTAFATLGLDGIVVRELVKDESRVNELLGTAFWLKVAGAFLVLGLLAIAVNFTSNDTTTNYLIFIIASATVFQSFNMSEHHGGRSFETEVMRDPHDLKPFFGRTFIGRYPAPYPIYQNLSPSSRYGVQPSSYEPL